MTNILGVNQRFRHRTFVVIELIIRSGLRGLPVTVRARDLHPD